MRRTRRGRSGAAAIGCALLAAACGSADEASQPDDDASRPEVAADAEDDEPDDGDRDEADDGRDDADSPATGEAACPDADTNLEPDLPDIAESVERATGDVMGDGRPDEVVTYAIGSGDEAVYMLRVETASGYVVEASLDDATALAPVRPLGVASIGGDREVAFVVETTGASGVNVGLWGLHDFGDQPCALARITIPDHTAGLTFTVGGTVGQASGLGCRDTNADGSDELVVVTAESTGDDSYDWTESAWHWPGGGGLQHVGVDEGTDAPEELEGRMGLDCPSVEAP